MSENQYFDVPEEDVEDARSVQISDRVTLPFPNLFLWWKNGSMQAAKDKTVRYHGGWAANIDETNETLAQMMLDDLPVYFTEPMSFTNRDGNEFQVYTARYVPIAVIDRRKAWFERDSGGRYSKVQILGYMADLDKDNKEFVPWGPVVLSARGYSSMHMERAFQRWQTVTAQARAKFSKSNKPLPAWIFYALVGTVSSERITESVGSGNQTSMITPCKVREPSPDEMTFEKMQKWFVGHEVVQEMNELRALADEWLHAWDDVDAFSDDQPDEEEDEEIPGDWPVDHQEEKAETESEENFADMV